MDLARWHSLLVDPMLSGILNPGGVYEAVLEPTVAPVSLRRAAQRARNMGQVSARSGRPLGHVLARHPSALPLDSPSPPTRGFTMGLRGGIHHFRPGPGRTKTTARSGVVTSRIQAVRNGAESPGYRLRSSMWREVDLANLPGRVTLKGGVRPLSHHSATGGSAGSPASPLFRLSGPLCVCVCVCVCG